MLIFIYLINAVTNLNFISKIPLKLNSLSSCYIINDITHTSKLKFSHHRL